jgi:hypothetical protein
MSNQKLKKSIIVDYRKKISYNGHTVIKQLKNSTYGTFFKPNYN